MVVSVPSDTVAVGEVGVSDVVRILVAVVFLAGCTRGEVV